MHLVKAICSTRYQWAAFIHARTGNWSDKKSLPVYKIVLSMVWEKWKYNSGDQVTEEQASKGHVWCRSGDFNKFISETGRHFWILPRNYKILDKLSNRDNRFILNSVSSKNIITCSRSLMTALGFVGLISAKCATILKFVVGQYDTQYNIWVEYARVL